MESVESVDHEKIAGWCSPAKLCSASHKEILPKCQFSLVVRLHITTDQDVRDPVRDP